MALRHHEVTVVSTSTGKFLAEGDMTLGLCQMFCDDGFVHAI
jgi:hypothetical protein